MITGVADTKANGGYRLYAEDSSGNYGVWYVAGKDTHPGGWGYFAIAPQTPPTYYNGSLNTGQTLIDYASVRYLGFQLKTLSTITGTNPNCFWDVSRYGTGITVTSADGDAVDFEDLYQADETGFWGVIKKVDGVYAVQGLITLDNGSTGIDFTPNGDWVVWKENAFIPNALQGLTVNGYASGVVNIEMANVVMKGVGVTKPYINFSDTDIDVGTIAGCTFVNFAPSTFAGMDSIVGSAFDNCGQITTEGCEIYNTSHLEILLIQMEHFCFLLIQLKRTT